MFSSRQFRLWQRKRRFISKDHKDFIIGSLWLVFASLLGFIFISAYESSSYWLNI